MKTERRCWPGRGVACLGYSRGEYLLWREWRDGAAEVSALVDRDSCGSSSPEHARHCGEYRDSRECWESIKSFCAK